MLKTVRCNLLAEKHFKLLKAEITGPRDEGKLELDVNFVVALGFELITRHSREKHRATSTSEYPVFGSSRSTTTVASLYDLQAQVSYIVSNCAHQSVKSVQLLITIYTSHHASNRIFRYRIHHTA